MTMPIFSASALYLASALDRLATLARRVWFSLWSWLVERRPSGPR